MASECVVRLRGLPWSCTVNEIAAFLVGVNIVPGDTSVIFVKNFEGRNSGEGFVAVQSEEDVNKALTFNNQHIGKRYIEVYAGNMKDMHAAMARSGIDVGYSAGENNYGNNTTSTIIKMRGLPFGCSKEEIANFFGGLMIARNGITILKDAQGRASGDAFVEFASSDMVPRALEKNKESIGHRYIELFQCDNETRNIAITRNQRHMDMDDRPRGRPGPYERQRFNDRPYDDGRRGRYEDMDRGAYGRGGYDDRDQMRGGYGDSGYDRGYQRREEYPQRRMDYETERYDENARYGNGGYNGQSQTYANGQQYSNGQYAKPRAKPAPKRLYKYDSTTGFNVHMRGLPYQATDQDICDFFKPLRPMNIVRHINDEGRSAGEADVDFYTDGEALQAMQRDKESIQHRYIELFYFNTSQNQPATEAYTENKAYVQQY